VRARACVYALEATNHQQIKAVASNFGSSLGWWYVTCPI